MNDLYPSFARHSLLIFPLESLSHELTLNLGAESIWVFQNWNYGGKLGVFTVEE